MDKIFICTEDTSNKFWGYKVNSLVVTCKWGRLGTAGQTKDFPFASQSKLDKFIESKTEEKLNKGYEERSPEKLELETVVAQAIGVGNKIERIAFVQANKKKLKILDPKRDRKTLHDPTMQPMVYAMISGRRGKDSDEIPQREFLLGLNEAKVIKTSSNHWNWEEHDLLIESELPVEISDEAQAMAQAVGSCIGKLLL